MNHPATIVLALLVLATPLQAQSQGESPRTHQLDRARFPIGERLEYEAKFGLLRLGRASMEIMGVDTVRADSALHVQFTLEGGMALYRLRDIMDSWIDVESFESLRFIQDFNEGGNHRYNAYEIFPDSGVYYQSGIDTAMATSVHPLDDAAFFYFVRNVDLIPGQRYEFDNYFKPDRNPVILEVVERDTIDTRAGRFATVVVRPIIKGGGIFREDAEGRLWITDDDRRLVVQIKSKFSFIEITLRLENVEGIPSPALAED